MQADIARSRRDQLTAVKIACEQALLFGQAKRASRERASEGLLSSAPRGFAARSRVLARPVLLAQTGELASRLLSKQDIH